MEEPNELMKVESLERKDSIVIKLEIEDPNPNI